MISNSLGSTMTSLPLDHLEVNKESISQYWSSIGHTETSTQKVTKVVCAEAKESRTKLIFTSTKCQSAKMSTAWVRFYLYFPVLLHGVGLK